MSKLVVRGGKSLNGTVTPVANKNSILKLIPACLLTDETVTIHNVPDTSDVKYMLEIIEKLGGRYERSADKLTVKINCADVHVSEIDRELSDKMKASVMFLGPLLLKLGKASMPTPQGCKLGTRPLDVLIENMMEMGAIYSHDNGSFHLTVGKDGLRPHNVWQWFPSVTGTENLIILATKVAGKTIIYNASCEPHTQDLCNMLVSMGAKIEGIGSNRIIVEGVEKLSGTERTVASDHLDVGGLIAAAVMTNGEITIKNAMVEHMGIIVSAMNKMGIHLQINAEKNEIFVPKQTDLKIKTTIKGDIQDFMAGPWPLLPMDFMPILLVLAMHCHGSAIIQNSFYTTQFFFIQELAKMKGRSIMADPHRVITFGPTKWQAANMLCGDIIQSSYGMLLAALAAPGTSSLNAITPLFRRFPNFVEQFTQLGADMELVE